MIERKRVGWKCQNMKDEKRHQNKEKQIPCLSVCKKQEQTRRAPTFLLILLPNQTAKKAMYNSFRLPSRATTRVTKKQSTSVLGPDNAQMVLRSGEIHASS